HRAGSRAWRDDAVRAGVWVSTRPHPELERGIAQSPTLEEASPPSGAAWPQRLVLNIRDDRAVVDARVELRDASRRPHAVVAAWDVAVDTTGGTQGTHPLGSNLTLESGGARLRLRLAVEPDLNATAKQGLARKWAPILAFDSEESFHPVPGAALERFHGFSRRPPDLRTWDPGFNNGRDEYRLLLADFDGDGRVDHRDARLMAEVLANGPVGAPTVHAHVMRTHMDEVVVQYWFLYFYNFVVDEAGRDVRTLAHNGDREFIQLRFASLSDALEGRPASVAYSQHYGGVRFLAPQAGDVPFHLDPHHPSVFVSRGSHASYPVAGDDRAGRPAFVGYFDRFDGNGARWGPDDYTLDVLASQSWHMAHLWGPATRHTRELGTSFRPLLQYDFRYPYHDPYDWERDLAVLTPLQALERYGRT
ncbi:MAG TPA: hypothetical protein VFH47_02260, partial [Candidatus Thermoplasmatota archaeon]|nr:hypothetical protein [Candidatus Thermoplasmatota archaeon]